MMLPLSRWILPVVCASPVAAQIEEMINVSMRVISTEPRIAVVDHGSVDGLALKDRVTFRTRTGARVEGTIVRVDARTAGVELDDPSVSLPSGTRAEARVPKARLVVPIPPPPPSAVPTAPDQPVPEHPPWERTDDEWTQDQPLLSQIRPFRPREREPRTIGRVYSILDYIYNTEGERSDTFARLGTDLTFENIFNQGGTLHFDAEENYRNTDVPDDDDEEGTNFRLDRLSYAFGGDRFAPNRFELGRFLQHELPEFGVLDGLEWSQRTNGGNTFGASVGFMPEPDADQHTGDDAQFAASYRWIVDESELLSFQAGYQKTFHDGDADRDLFVAKLLYFPPRDWDFSATAWLDWYTSGDTAKDSGPELTQAYVTTGRTFDGGSSLRATYTHRAFPEIERNEFLPVTAAQLADDRSDRATLSGRHVAARNFALTGLVGAWNDEDETGGDAEGGFQVDNFLFEDATFDAVGFGVVGRFNTTLGWRASIGTQSSHGLWRFGYEGTLNDIDGFESDNNSIPQHRVGVSFETYSDSGWSFSTHVDGLFFDSEAAVLVGLFLQRSF